MKQLKEGLTFRTRLHSSGRSFVFKIPKMIINFGYLKKGKEYKVWIEEIKED